jgi:hypothetical protein
VGSARHGACRRLAELAREDPALVAVHGGTGLTRSLLCERARMHHGLPALLVDPAPDLDQAITAVLSGRADLVGVPAGVARQWQARA